MKYIKMLGLLAVAAAAFMAFAGTASASNSTLTSSGATYTSTIEASAGETTLHGVSTITCQKSTVKGKVERHTTNTAGGKVSSLTFSECGEDHVSVKKAGEISIDKAGSVYSTGAEISITLTKSPLGHLTCVFTTENTKVGTLTGGTPAVLDINSATIDRTGGSFFCGESGVWTGSYTVTTPGNLSVH
jgi:hypothetical protein